MEHWPSILRYGAGVTFNSAASRIPKSDEKNSVAKPNADDRYPATREGDTYYPIIETPVRGPKNSSPQDHQCAAKRARNSD